MLLAIKLRRAKKKKEYDSQFTHMPVFVLFWKTNKTPSLVTSPLLPHSACQRIILNLGHCGIISNHEYFTILIELNLLQS